MGTVVRVNGTARIGGCRALWNAREGIGRPVTNVTRDGKSCPSQLDLWIQVLVDSHTDDLRQ